MDKRFRVYYLVNFNHRWWDSNLDIGGIVYNENLGELQRRVPSLKITPNKQQPGEQTFQKKLSCLNEEETMLRNAMGNLKYISWTKVE